MAKEEVVLSIKLEDTTPGVTKEAPQKVGTPKGREVPLVSEKAGDRAEPREVDEETGDLITPEVVGEGKKKRRRKRKKKVPDATEAAEKPEAEKEDKEEEKPAKKKRRRRPRKSGGGTFLGGFLRPGDTSSVDDDESEGSKLADKSALLRTIGIALGGKFTGQTRRVASAAATATKTAGMAGASETAAEAIGSAAISIGAVGIAAGAVAGAMAALVLGTLKLNEMFQSIAQDIAPFSGAVQQAQAREQIAAIQRRMDRANEIGDTIAGIVDSNRELKDALNGLTTSILGLIGPFVTEGIKFFTAVIEILNAVIGWIDSIEGFGSDAAEIATRVLKEVIVQSLSTIFPPMISRNMATLIGRALEWFDADEEKKTQENMASWFFDMADQPLGSLPNDREPLHAIVPARNGD